MTLRLHNTLTRTKEDFVPIDAANVRMYVCGPTVYDFAHIGNARPLIVFDVLFRLLRHLYGESHVTYARNITDVDDKINARAAEEYPGLPLNDAIRKVTTRTEDQFHLDVDALGCLRPTHEPRATEFICDDGRPEDMIRLIGKLIERGHAYVAEGHVLFDVPSMPDYGRLSNRTLDEMIAGARVDVAPYKKDAMDFVLWKPSKPGEPAWPSPWGMGRPGWHIECSAMAGALLGETFDIHGGGIDLIFPHHENEIAQSRCAHGTRVMANYWLHNGFLQVEGQKMSKSLGNFVTIREVLKDWPGAVVRFNMLRTHYRQPVDWTNLGLNQSLMELIGLLKFAEGIGDSGLLDLPEEFLAAVADDLNTPLAISQLHEMQAKILRSPDPLPLYHQYRNALRMLTGHPIGSLPTGKDLRATFERPEKVRVLIKAAEASAPKGLAEALARAFEMQFGEPITRRAIEKRVSLGEAIEQAFDNVADRLITARAAARKAKNFAEADRIRAELDAMGIQLRDAKDPQTGELVTTWEVKR